MKTSQTQKGKARCENSIERKNFTRSLHPDQRVTQAICRVCSRPLDSSMHIRCIVTERNEATADPYLEAEFEKVFSKGGVQ